jgi:hypothetical protein
MFLRDGLETPSRTGRLGRPEKQHAAVTQGEMEEGVNLMLRLRLQIDEKVAAADKIQAREGRVRQDVMDREDDSVAQFANNPVMVVRFGEKSGQPVRRHIRLDRIRIETIARQRYGVRIDVGSKDLDLHRPLQYCESF